MAVNRGLGASPRLKLRTTSQHRLDTLEETVCMMKVNMVAIELVSVETGEDEQEKAAVVAVGEHVPS